MNIPNNHDEMQFDAWIGLAHVEAREGNLILGNSTGAIVPVIALAFHQNDFVTKAVKMLNACDFEVIEIEDIEPFAKRTVNCNVASYIVDLAASLSNDNPIVFGNFQAFNNG